MELIDRKTGKIIAENVVSQISRIRLNSTSERFHFPFEDMDDAASCITAYMKAEVERRGHTMFITDDDKQHIARVSDWLVNGNKAGMILCGGVGNGKTTLLNAVCRLINSIYYSPISYERRGFMWDTAVKIAAECESGSESYDLYRMTEWLAIDDLGQEPLEVSRFGNILYPIRDLISYRYDNNLITLMTSNLTPSAISTRYGERIADRLKEMMDIVVFENDSRR